MVQQCMIYADLIVVASDFNAEHSLYKVKNDLDLYTDNILNKKTYLLMVHGEKSDIPVKTQKWLEHRKADLHIHIRRNHSNDIGRLCRILTNKAVCLVLGGGGAKGFAHIGPVQAQQEKGIQIDFLGGTSAGALYGIGMCFADFDFEKIHTINAEGVRRRLTSRDLTIPLISLMSGNKFKAYIKEMFADHDMEDIWVKSFCISTNLSRGETEVLNSGPLWRKVLASMSMSIPGISPPVVIDNHLHVDGGIMDNLPIQAMYQYPVDKILAISLTSLEIKKINLSEVPGPWKLLRDKLSANKSYSLPGISSVIINSLTIKSLQRQTPTKEMGSHYLKLDLKGIGMIEDKKWK